MLRCYPNIQIGDIETYSAALVSVLSRYSKDVIIAVTEPATGVVSRCKWPPAVADLVEACEALAPKAPRRTYAMAVEETLSRRCDPAFDFPRVAGPAGSEDDEYGEFVAGRRGRGTRDQRTRHIGEVLRKYGFFDLAKKF